ncbi:MAG: TetR family transcriptional regulator [Limisphaerales bacterium]
MARLSKNNGGTARNPDRTRARIIAAALKEFSAHGFAGARVDAIARSAAINKRMLYHYFGDKEALFRAVLRRKIIEQQAWAEASSGEPEETLPFWFNAACKDADWVRLLEWEALQGNPEKPLDQKKRRVAVERSIDRVRQRQARGQLSAEFDARHLVLAMRSLTMFPIAFPQLTRFIMGRPVTDPKFQQGRVEFLRQFASALRPAQAIPVKINFKK